MKKNVCIFQPGYSVDCSRSTEYFEWELAQLDRLDSSIDIVVLPEGADMLCKLGSPEMVLDYVKRNTSRLIEKASETARRCNAIVFANCYTQVNGRFRNTTLAFDRNGEIAGRYFKQHLTRGEEHVLGLDASYTYEYDSPMVLELDGMRFAFLTCYDFYFYEQYANIAKENVDIIIGCAQQKSDRLDVTETFASFLAYNCNAYVLRSGVTLNDGSSLAGGSMVVAPDGRILLNLEERMDVSCVEIDTEKKLYKPGGFGNPDCAHWEYVEQGRRPWKYRQSGSSIVLDDDHMPYPRTCAHRGFPAVAPEGTMPGFGAAVALGAQEIEFDVWWTKDGELVVSHDRSLERCSDGTGLVTDYTYEELLKFDFGAKFGNDSYKGLRIPKFEEVLAQFACRVIMNIHIKTGNNKLVYNVDLIKKIAALIHKYGCEKYCYFMTGNDILLKQLAQYAPGIKRCVGAGDEPDRIVDRAIEMGCEKVQLFLEHASAEMTAKAHEHGIICNVYYADTEKRAREYLDMGCDVILTNDCNNIMQVVKAWASEH